EITPIAPDDRAPRLVPRRSSRPDETALRPDERLIPINERAASPMIPLQSCELLPESRYVWRAGNPDHTHRLICFPHAGAGASAFAEWAGLLQPEVELVAVQLPGRQDRIAAEPSSAAGPLVNALVHALRPVLDGAFSFFGHSGGAALA